MATGRLPGPTVGRPAPVMVPRAALAAWLNARLAAWRRRPAAALPTLRTPRRPRQADCTEWVFGVYLAAAVAGDPPPKRAAVTAQNRARPPPRRFSDAQLDEAFVAVPADLKPRRGRPQKGRCG